MRLPDSSRLPGLKSKLDQLEKAKRRQVLTATVEGQTVFTITNGSYVVGSETLDVIVGTVPQPPSAYTETNSTTITLSEGVPVGTKVILYWLEGKLPIEFGHNTSHYSDGQDPIDVTKLKGFTENGLNGVKVLQGKAGAYVDAVVDFGADPTGVKDSTTAIQNALNFLTNGGVLFIPEGRYKISAKLIAKQNTVIVGAGMNRTFIDWDASNATLTWMVEFTVNTSDKWSRISDLSLDQKRAERNLVDNQAYGGIHACTNLTVERVRIRNTAGPGITQATIQNFRATECEIYDTGHHGIYFSSDSGGYVKNITITNNYIGTPGNITGRLLGAHAIKFRFGDYVDTLENITIRDNKLGAGVQGEGINISTTTGGDCSLKKLTIENNIINIDKNTTSGMTSGIYIGANSKGDNISIIRNQIYGSGIAGSYGMRVLFSNAALTKNVVIKQNTIENVERGIDSRQSLIDENAISFTVNGIFCVSGKASRNKLESSTDSAVGIDQATIDMVENEINVTGLNAVGIKMANSTNLFVKGNKITGASQGISRNVKSLTNCVFVDNIFITCTQGYVGFTDSTSTMKSNLFESTIKDRHGVTADRPTPLYVGERYFDTTLNKPIWCKTVSPVAWVDAIGTVV